jgi:nitroreductase
MEFFRVIESRHSVRAFEDRPLDDDDLQAILEAMNRAPSAGDLQSYEVVVVTDPERRLRLAQAAGQEFLARAPAVLVFFMHPDRSRATYGQRGERLYTFQDAAIAAAYAQLAAHARGLGTVWVGAFDDRHVARAVAAPHDLAPAAIIAVGHAAEHPEATPRRALDDVVHRDSFA